MTAVGVAATSTGAAEQTTSERWVALSGVLFAVLLGASVLTTAGMPDAKNAAKAQAWDIKNKGLVSLSSILTLAAVIVGVYFLTWLYTQLTRKSGGWMGTMFIVGAVIFAMAGTVAAGVNAVIGSDAKHLSTDSLQLMSSLNQNLNYGMTCAGLAIMYLGAGYLVRRTGLLPGWLAYVSWVFAFLAATFFLGFIALLGTALWLIVAGIYLAAHPPSQA